MLTTALMFSSFTAFLTTALVVGSVDPTDLKGKRVATVEGSTGARVARTSGAKVRTESSLSSALVALTKGEVEAVVFDTPALQYWLRKHPDFDLIVAPCPGTEEHYSFAFFAAYGRVYGPNVPSQWVDIALLTIREKGKLQEIRDRWISEI